MSCSSALARLGSDRKGAMDMFQDPAITLRLLLCMPFGSSEARGVRYHHARSHACKSSMQGEALPCLHSSERVSSKEDGGVVAGGPGVGSLRHHSAPRIGNSRRMRKEHPPPSISARANFRRPLSHCIAQASPGCDPAAIHLLPLIAERNRAAFPRILFLSSKEQTQ